MAKPNPELKFAVQALYTQGFNQTEIARTLSIPRQSVWAKLGAKLRKVHFPPRSPTPEEQAVTEEVARIATTMTANGQPTYAIIDALCQRFNCSRHKAKAELIRAGLSTSVFKKLTDKQLEVIAARIAAGERASTIAGELGITHKALSARLVHWRKRNGLTRPRRKNWEYVTQQIEAGIPVREIADALECTPANIYQMLRHMKNAGVAPKRNPR
jgi:DNA-binding NarL/FixJ family response regulator